MRRKNRRGQFSAPAERINPCDLLPENERKTALLLTKGAKSRLSFRNSAEMLLNGEETFSAIKAALRRATRYIHLEYYSIENDGIGNEIRDLLIAKASEGVAVRMIYDSVGSWKLGKKFIDSLRNGGVQAHPFLPVSFPMLRRDLNYRNHRKIIVVDGKTGFVGGLNIGDNYIHGEPGLGTWRDTHLKIEGEAVSCLDDIFSADWAFCDSKHPPEHRMDPALIDTDGTTPVQVVSSGPDSNWRSILHGYFSMIANAKRSLWLCTPYLVPGRSLSTALAVAAMSGIDVRVMIPRASDHALVHWASLSFVEELLRAGAKIFGYEKGFIHAKILIADETIVSVGTANFDARSLEINFEVQAFLYDRAVAEVFRNQFLNDMDDCCQFRLHDWLKRPLRSRFLESAGRLWSSQL
jgi:cardiolipin synthase